MSLAKHPLSRIEGRQQALAPGAVASRSMQGARPHGSMDGGAMLNANPGRACGAESQVQEATSPRPNNQYIE